MEIEKSNATESGVGKHDCKIWVGGIYHPWANRWEGWYYVTLSTSCSKDSEIASKWIQRSGFKTMKGFK